MTMRRALVILSVLAALAPAGCGSEGTSYSDEEIVKALGLEKAAGGYTLGGDPFCRVRKLLHDADEVEQAGENEKSRTLSSPAGNAGVVVSPLFPRDCEQRAEAGLRKLDPKPKDE